ncbi:hypothetical protein [Roseovarius nanhaiticus]|uniref:hypothetical protein n=1 Tax=Roseovarius nanhaiticus TaxID=573024 RepID=UPI0024912080|nr:hypothetical protein [Roseovarius nanhaiticus]
MPHAQHRYARHAASGFGMAGALVGLLFWLDTGQLRQIVAFSGNEWIAAAVMWLGIGSVFAGLKCVIARIDSDDDDDEGPRGGGGHRGPQGGQMIPIRVEARWRERR